MSYESQAEPIKLGYLFDFKLPDAYPDEMRKDLTRPFELVFKEGLEQGLIDRPVEIVYREVEGLPKGTIKAVIDAYGELVDEGCLAVFGPAITDNTVPTKEAIEERFHVPALSCTGTEEWLGEWTFALPQGSMTDEPIFWADLIAKDGYTTVGALVERSLVGESYIQGFRRACAERGIQIVAEEWIPQTAQDIGRAGAGAARRQAAGHRALRLRLRHRVRDHGARPSSTGIHLATWAPPSRTRGSTRSCGTRSSDGRAWTSTTRATRSARPSSTGTRPSTTVDRRTACRS